MQQIAGMGIDLFQIQDFLDQKGLWEQEPNTFLELMNAPMFVNVLKQGSLAAQQVMPGMSMAPQGQPMGMPGQMPQQQQQNMMMQQ